MQRIDDLLMVCQRCGAQNNLGDCNLDDATDATDEGDGNIGCPIADCGGTMKVQTA